MGDQCFRGETPLFANISEDKRNGPGVYTRQVINVKTELFMLIEFSEKI